MWCSVVHRLMLDAAQSNRDGELARAWLQQPDQTVLDFAGLDRGAFVAATRELANAVVEKPKRQRAMVAARIANLGDGQRGDLIEGTSIEAASSLLNVGRASLSRVGWTEMFTVKQAVRHSSAGGRDDDRNHQTQAPVAGPTCIARQHTRASMVDDAADDTDG
jgi:hypothetical protein